MNVKNFIKHPLGIIALTFTLIALVVLLGTPYVIKKELKKWIISHGSGSVQTDNVDFNPFTGRLSLYNLQLDIERGRALHIVRAHLNFSWALLLQKRIYIKKVILEETYLLVDSRKDAGFRFAGLVLPDMTDSTEEEKSSPGWSVAIKRFEIINSKIEYDTPQLAAMYHIDHYELTDLKSWEKQQPVNVKLQGRIDDSPIYIDAELTPFAESGKFKGKLKLEQAELSLISKILDIEDIALEGKLDIDLNVESVRQQDKLINFSIEGDISIGALQLAYGDMAFTDEKVSWHGTISGNKPPVEGYTLSGEGKLSLESLGASLPSQSMSVQTKGLQWQGSVNYEVQKDSQDLTMAANLEGARATIGDTARNINLVDLKEVAVNTIDIQGLNDMSVAEIVLQKLVVFSKVTGDTTGQANAKKSLLQADNINIKDISYKDLTVLAAGDATLDSFQAYLRHQKEGGWYLLDTASAQDATSVEPEKLAAEVEEKTAGKSEPVAQVDRPVKEPESAETSFHFRLGQLQTKNDSSIQFVDESTSRPYHLTVQVEELQVSDIDTTEPARPMQLKVNGTVGDYSKIGIDGTLLPFAKPISVNAKGNIKALRMPPLSSYSGQYMGYNITSGQLDADINFNIDKGNLGGNADLHMRNLEIARVDPEKVPEIDTQMKVPLDSGLSMLRDKEDVINLDIELKGDIANPQFNFQDAMNQAIAKTMTFASISFLKYTLQPFGTFIAIAELAGKAGEKMTKVQLDSVQFGAAEISLDETARQYLEKVAIILNDRPKLTLDVCGKAVENDRIALLAKREAAVKQESDKTGVLKKEAAEVEPIPDTVLQDFARERAKLVKDFLVNDHGVNHDRIYLCLPAIDQAPDKGPYVEMLID
jgi:hypothetical protein